MGIDQGLSRKPAWNDLVTAHQMKFGLDEPVTKLHKLLDSVAITFRKPYTVTVDACVITVDRRFNHTRTSHLHGFMKHWDPTIVHAVMKSPEMVEGGVRYVEVSGERLRYKGVLLACSTLAFRAANCSAVSLEVSTHAPKSLAASTKLNPVFNW